MINFFSNKKTIKGSRKEDLPELNDGFPDSTKPYGLCPRCNKQSSFETLGILPATFSSGILLSPDGNNKRDFYDRVASMECRNCNQPVIVLEEKFIGDKAAKDCVSSGTVTWEGFFWWPFANINYSEEVPETIQRIIQEAKVTYAAQCYRASAVMARRALEAIAVDKGELDGKLVHRIKNLVSAGKIDKNLGDWATEIRLIGNTAAHYDSADDVEKEDANQIILFLDQLINYIYIMPAIIIKSRTKSK
jgi:hypothetical protein